jgi:Protein of unknown function (DUF4058)
MSKLFFASGTLSMASPFPGMNPYLENPTLWPEVHHLLIAVLAETLNPQLLPKYRVAVEKRVYQTVSDDILLVGIPDVAIATFRDLPSTKPSNPPVATVTKPISVTLPMPLEISEGYLEIREIASQQVVTVIEILSPANKKAGKGYDAYITKRQEILTSQTHLVEIDLLHEDTPMAYQGNVPTYDYRILISRSQNRPRADLYGFNLRELIPLFSLPLQSAEQSTDNEPAIDLHTLLDIVYARAGYAFAIDYDQAPYPKLSHELQAWCRETIENARNET